MINTENLGGDNVALKKMCSDFSGMFFLSACFQPGITAAIFLGAQKVAAGLRYPDGMKKFLQIPLGAVARQGMDTVKRRTVASLSPAVASTILAEAWNLSPAFMVAMNTSFETSVASTLFKESAERFGAVNSYYSVLSRSGVGIPLATITKESFFENIGNSDRTAGFGIKEWDILKGRLDTYQANFSHQFASLVLRNGIFSAAAFGARPIAKAFVKDRSAELQSMTGMGSDAIENIATYTLRAALAWATTPFDRAFTLYSSGELTAKEVNEKIFGEVKSGNFSRLFRGAGARTVMCLLTATSIAEGGKVGDAMSEWIKGQNFQDLFKSVSSSISEDPAAQDRRAMRERSSSIEGDPVVDAGSVDCKEANKALKDSGMSFGPISDEELKAAFESATNSCDAVSRETAEWIAEFEGLSSFQPKPTASNPKASRADRGSSDDRGRVELR
jgi:hypothetical protein